MSNNSDLYAPKAAVPTAIIAVRVTVKMHIQFSELCASHNTDMSSVIRNFIEREITGV